MKKSRAGAEITTVSDVLGKLLGTQVMQAGLELGRITAAWPCAAGELASAASQPVRFEKGRLRVAVRNSAWANELQLCSVEIIERLNGMIGESRVRELSFYVADPKSSGG
jgi:hypothetical protein